MNSHEAKSPLSLDSLANYRAQCRALDGYLLVVGAVTGTASLNAAIHADPVIAGDYLSFSNSTQYIDFDGGGSNDLRLDMFFNITSTPYFIVANGAAGMGAGSSIDTIINFTDYHPANLAFGQTVLPSAFDQPFLANFATGTYYKGFTTFGGAAGNFTPANPSGYILFAFDDETAGATNYGWMDITVTFTTVGTSDIPDALIVHNWAYDDTGAILPAGTIPEPSQTAVGLGVLALGAAGLRRFRKRKAA